MKALKFKLSGDTAFFKKPDVNSYVYFTYGNIHKVALLGIIGAILGLPGYGFQEKEETYPQFYEKLRNIKVSILPENENGVIAKKIQVFNNSVGYASKEEGGNLIVKEQWLEKPRWAIYILLENEEIYHQIEKSFTNYSFKYIPYLGKNDHYANISDVQIITNEDIKIINPENIKKVDSLFLKKNFVITNEDDIDYEDDTEYEEIIKWKYEEQLPLELEPQANQYLKETFAQTNMTVKSKDNETIYRMDDKYLYFF